MKLIGMLFVFLYCLTTLASYFVPDNSIQTAQIFTGSVTQPKLDNHVSGMKNDAITTSTTTSTSFVDIDAGVSFVATGRAVYVGITSANTGSCSILASSASATVVGGEFQALVAAVSRTAGVIGIDAAASLGATSITLPGSSFFAIYLPTIITSGTYTVKMQMKAVSGTTLTIGSGCQIIVYEI